MAMLDTAMNIEVASHDLREVMMEKICARIILSWTTLPNDMNGEAIEVEGEEVVVDIGFTD